MIREKMDFEHDELVPYTPIAGAVYRWKNERTWTFKIDKLEERSLTVFLVYYFAGRGNP